MNYRLVVFLGLSMALSEPELMCVHEIQANSESSRERSKLRKRSDVRQNVKPKVKQMVVVRASPAVRRWASPFEEPRPSGGCSTRLRPDWLNYPIQVLADLCSSHDEPRLREVHPCYLLALHPVD